MTKSRAEVRGVWTETGETDEGQFQMSDTSGCTNRYVIYQHVHVYIYTREVIKIQQKY